MKGLDKILAGILTVGGVAIAIESNISVSGLFEDPYTSAQLLQFLGGTAISTLGVCYLLNGDVFRSNYQDRKRV